MSATATKEREATSSKTSKTSKEDGVTASSGKAATQPSKATTQRKRRTASPAASDEGKDEPSKGTAAKKRGVRNQELGKKGEDAAERYLAHRGYEILERNWTCDAGEADIIARDGRCLVFVEVKTRKSTERGFPSEAVNAKKRGRYEKIALAYASSYPEAGMQVRFDVISIVVIAKDKAMIRHHLNAFTR